MCFDRGTEAAAELSAVAEQARQGKVEQRPQFAQVVFQRGAGKAQAVAGGEFAGLQRKAIDLGRLAVRSIEVELRYYYYPLALPY